jgi:hypothetical protein
MQNICRIAGLMLMFVLPVNGQSGTATVHFYGEGGFGVRHVPLYIDEKKVGNLHGREIVDIPVTPGKHTVHSGEKLSGIYLDATEGGEFYVKVTLTTGGVVPHGQVALVDPAQGKYELETRQKGGRQPKPAS